MVDNQEEATHVLQWDSTVDGVLPVQLTEEYIRSLEVRWPSALSGVPGNAAAATEGMALVHWWYHPDSYDEWIPAVDVDMNDVPDIAVDVNDSDPLSLVWEICCRFVYDVALFNEWGNETDYEIDLDKEVYSGDTQKNSSLISVQNDSKSRNRRGKKSKYIGDDSAGAKQSGAKKGKSSADGSMFGTILEASIATEKAMSDVPPPSCAPARVAANPADAGLKFNVIDVSVSADASVSGQSGTSFSSAVEVPSVVWGGRTNIKSTAESEQASPETKRRRIGDSRSYSGSIGAPKAGGFAGATGAALKMSSSVPGWFRFDSVSTVEIRYLPDFFDGSSSLKTPDVYLSMRSFICNLYAQNPSVYLSATECRKKLSGDAGSVIRVHNFLDTFGIINSAVPAESRPPILPMSQLHPLHHPSSYSIHRAETLLGGNSAALLGTRYKQVMWDAATDEALTRSVLKHGTDWRAIGMEMGSVFAGSGVTTEDCMVRFAELPLSSSSAADMARKNPGECGENSMEISSEDGLNSSSKEHPIAGHVQNLLNEYIGARLTVLEEKVLLPQIIL